MVRQIPQGNQLIRTDEDTRTERNVRRSHLPTAPANENSRLSRPATRAIALLALSALINYIDRGSLSIAAPLLKAYPCYARMLVRHVPEVGRGFANAPIAAGVGCGPALGTFFGGTLMARFGWRSFFIVLGVVSMAWLVPWFAWIPLGRTVVSRVEQSGAGFLELLMQRSMWGTCGGLFGANYVLYFEITWLPFYLVRERHLSMGLMAKISGLGYLCYSAAAVAFGWISDRWIAAGATPTLVRKTFAGMGAGSAGLLLLGCALAGPTVSVILLLLAFAAGGMCGSNIWAITQTLAGPRMAGRWTGLQNFLGNLAGVIAPAVTGFLIDYTGRFFVAFVIMAVVALLAALSYIFAIGPVKEIAWEG